MSREKRIRDLIDTFHQMPGISVPKAAKIVGCTPKTVYNYAKTDPVLGQILSNRPSSKLGPPATRKVAPAGVSSLTDTQIDSAETEAFETLLDLMRDDNVSDKTRSSCAAKLLSYCHHERRKRGRQIIVDTTKVHTVEVKDGQPNKQIDWDPAKAAEFLAVDKPAGQE